MLLLGFLGRGCLAQRKAREVAVALVEEGWIYIPAYIYIHTYIHAYIYIYIVCGDPR